MINTLLRLRMFLALMLASLVKTRLKGHFQKIRRAPPSLLCESLPPPGGGGKDKF